MIKHGINTVRKSSSTPDAVTARSGIPVFVGAWPCHLGKGYVDKPQLVSSFEEAVELGGYSDNWELSYETHWSLCEAAYAFFKWGKKSPAIFINTFNPEHATGVNINTDRPYTVSERKVKMYDANTISVDTVKYKPDAQEAPVTLQKGTDYIVYSDTERFVIELLPDSDYASATQILVSYREIINPAVSAEEIKLALEKVEYCKGKLGIVPDLIVVPGFSKDPTVAAIMDAKAESINSMFSAKAIVDINSDLGAATSYSQVADYKKNHGIVGENTIACWPKVKIGNKTFNFSTILAAVIAEVDSANDDCPYVSPSNEEIEIDGLVTGMGEEVFLTPTQADAVSVDAAVVTALNFGGWRIWGNYTAYAQIDEDDDFAKDFICCSRMLDYVGNNFVHNNWAYLDGPLTVIVRDAMINSFNAWLNALTAEGKLYGGEAVYHEDDNQTSEILKGRFTIETVMASPLPLQEITHNIVASRDIVVAAFAED